jgi:hypothetical protein
VRGPGPTRRLRVNTVHRRLLPRTLLGHESLATTEIYAHVSELLGVSPGGR